MAGTGMNVKEEIPSAQKDYIKSIKEELNIALEKSKLKITQLAEILSDTYGFNVNKGTLKALFNCKSESMNYACLVTVCKFFGMDFNELLAPKVMPKQQEEFAYIGDSLKQGAVQESPVSDAFWDSIESTREKFPVLEDDEYVGEYQGYIVPPSGEFRIRPFSLTLRKDAQGTMHATMIRNTSGKRKKKTTALVYRGVPLLAKAYNAVIMFLTNEDKKGEFYFLSFGFERYHPNQGLVYRQGLSVTGEGFGRSSVVAQSFVIFQQPLSQENEKYLAGLVKAPNNQFCIAAEDAKKLAAEYPEVRKFLEKAADAIDRRTKDVIVLREDNILSLDLGELSKCDRIKALLLLKGRSSVEGKYYYRANSTYTEFALNYLSADEDDTGAGEISVE